MRFTRDGHSRIARMDLADGTHLTYAYDPAGDLVSVTDPRSSVVSLCYDAHRLVSFSDLGHPSAVNSYDADGRLLSTRDPLGRLTDHSNDLQAWTESVVTPTRVQLDSSFDADGLLIRVDESFAGEVRTTTYGAASKASVGSRTSSFHAARGPGYPSPGRAGGVILLDRGEGNTLATGTWVEAARSRMPSNFPPPAQVGLEVLTHRPSVREGGLQSWMFGATPSTRDPRKGPGARE